MVMQVTSVTSLTRSGLSDFVVQRATAMILTVYTAWVLGFFLLTPQVDHASLVAFFTNFPMQMFSTLAAVSTIGHAWVGLWTIGTDYLRPSHGLGNAADRLRLAYLAVCLLRRAVY
ncbi:MAG: succinate dehydrogenase, hydrophobic membrane anchor protein, partial [Proteobacteria bacterium]|nr:succinate dehydrogenase, hydrophobic membrane anchor protein [Pseudomonadota bacterium]